MREAAEVTRLRKGGQRSRKHGTRGRQSKEQEGVRKDGKGRSQRMKLYSHNDSAALYRADKAEWQQMRVDKADADVAAY